eukprot:212096-Chlamydomonas_euryale.AAC.3
MPIGQRRSLNVFKTRVLSPEQVWGRWAGMLVCGAAQREMTCFDMLVSNELAGGGHHHAGPELGLTVSAWVSTSRRINPQLSAHATRPA